jgi:hypothetical protein
MGLTELPSELFRMKNFKELWLSNNKLCSLPSEIAQLTALEELWVRLFKRLDRGLIKKSCCCRSMSTTSHLFRPNSVC